MMFFKKKAIKETTTPIYDRDAQMILALKSANLRDKTMGLIDDITYQLNDAEIDAIAMRIAERRVTNIEKALSNN